MTKENGRKSEKAAKEIVRCTEGLRQLAIYKERMSERGQRDFYIRLSNGVWYMDGSHGIRLTEEENERLVEYLEEQLNVSLCCARQGLDD